MHFLQPDSAAYDPSKLVWKSVDETVTPQLPVSSNATSGADWFISLDGWVMTAGNNHLSHSQSFIATVDPLYSDLYVPEDQAKLIRTCTHAYLNSTASVAHTFYQMMLYQDHSSGLTFPPLARYLRRGPSHATLHLASASLSAPKPSRLRQVP